MARTVFTPQLKGETSIDAIAKAIGEGLTQMGTYSAKAAAQANEVSRQAQAAQMAFNADQANQANMLTDMRLQNQYQFNSAQARSANEFTSNMWNQTAAWNEKMWEKQAAFNAEQAQIQRDWQEKMANTSYQRAMEDMQKAGLNPILAYSQGGADVPGGAAATVGGAQMASAGSAMATGGISGGSMGSASSYTGQMETMSGTIGLLSTALSGISTAQKALGNLGDFGEGLAESLGDMLTGDKGKKEGWYNTGYGFNIKEGSFADKVYKKLTD